MLYIVATPIGNLEDISHRALRILNQVDIIFAEDTRHTLGLLNHFSIKKPLRSCHEHNEIQRASEIVKMLEEGKQIALVSDAGLPGISDPGGKIIQEIIKANLSISIIPGANAALTALLLSGLPCDRFIFEGFLPRDNKNRGKVLKSFCSQQYTIILYENPLRVIKTLHDLLNVLGDRPAALCRELTKIYETCLRGNLSDLINQLKFAPKGECVIVIGAAKETKKDQDTPEQILARMRHYIDLGMRAKDAAKEVSNESISANELYKLYLSNE